MTENPLAQAVGLIKAGKIEAAREQLEQIIKGDHSNIPAWHWYAQTWSGTREKERIWEACLRFNPTSEQAQQALRDLRSDHQKVPIPEKKIPAARPRRTSSSRWLVWGIIGLLGGLAIIAWTLVKSSAPLDAVLYKHTQPVEYYLYVPKAYSDDKEWPLFVGIHGAGGNGLQCWNMFQAHAEKEGFILLCPSIPGDPGGFYQDVGENTVWSAVNDVQKQYHVRQRMFFSGFSAGAFFIQGFTYHYPRAVSGLSILSSGLYLDPAMFPEVIPMLVVIGGNDHPSAVQESRWFVNDLRKYGFNVQYEVMPGVGHTVTNDGIQLTMDTFRETIKK